MQNLGVPLPYRLTVVSTSERVPNYGQDDLGVSFGDRRCNSNVYVHSALRVCSAVADYGSIEEHPLQSRLGAAVSNDAQDLAL
jgi:hypothetical protein